VGSRTRRSVPLFLDPGCQPWEVTREPTDEELEAIIAAYQKAVESKIGRDDLLEGQGIDIDEGRKPFST
jgi:hypothetical protein